MFVGREKELNLLKDAHGAGAKIIVLKGRRRIGKTRLIEHYIEINKIKALVFRSVPPIKNSATKEQMDNFAKQLGDQSSISYKIDNWYDGFKAIKNELKNIKGKKILFFDEISWLCYGRKNNLLSVLFEEWEGFLKNDKNLLIVLCGSISHWLDENILESSAFTGRINHEIVLKHLSHEDVRKFYPVKLSDREILRIAIVFGGVPKYLEQYDLRLDFETNLKNLYFTSTGFLYREFNHIFTDIFGRRSLAYINILKKLSGGMKSLSQIDSNRSGVTLKYLQHLESGGFLSSHNPKGFEKEKKASKITYYGIDDNFMLFYLKYVYPNRKLIENGLGKIPPNLDASLGLLFENHVYRNMNLVLSKLGIDLDNVNSYGPYLQTQRGDRQKCQIDLLIETNSVLYLCEIKHQFQIDASVIKEVQNKINKLKVPKYYSLRPVLIYNGELTFSSDYFVKYVEF